jgi:hypothetical protein
VGRLRSLPAQGGRREDRHGTPDRLEAATPMKVPMTIGDSYSDIVVWKWDRSRSQWVATLADGSKLQVQYHKRVRNKGYWTYSIYFGNRIGAYASMMPFSDPTMAEETAVREWKRRK